MNIVVTIVIAILTNAIGQLLGGVMRDKLKSWGTQKPKRKLLTQKETHATGVKRLLYALFPPDIRTALLPINFVIWFYLFRELQSSEPVTRLSVIKIVLLTLGSFSILLINVAWGLYTDRRFLVKPS